MEKVLVSACLLGQAVRYDGASRPCAEVQALAGRFEFVPVCPECLGGLPIPRTPSEIDTGSDILCVRSRDGEDRTDAFVAGAQRCVDIAKQEGCVLAIMKANSPSCGCGAIYDGTFSGVLVPGDGVAVRMLKRAGLLVMGEKDLESWLNSEYGGQSVV